MVSKHPLSLMSFIIKLKQSLKNKFLKIREWPKSLKLKWAKARELHYKLSKTF
ncbi:hypothetical protein VN0405_05340 [Helicobacter pylori]|nr:hypothetical protein VN1196_07740 [Helicobacter pylori]GHQ75084.1 hypothetical protein VN0405_05340 [Helicobacter pylori]